MNKSESKYYNTAVKMNEAFLKLLNEKDFEYITVKEITALAKVNRSTFYLHYTTVDDLLMETCDYVSEKINSYFENAQIKDVDVSLLSDEELNFITPKYLVPWLTFIYENKKLFQTMIKKGHIFASYNYRRSVEKAVNHALIRLVPNKEDGEYLVTFHIGGIMALVEKWLKEKCTKSVNEIADLIVKCVYQQKDFL